MIRENNSIEEKNIKGINTTKSNTIENISFKEDAIMDVNAMEFIHMNVHLWLIMSLYLTYSLVLVHF